MRLNEAGMAAGRIIKERRDAMAKRITERYFLARPELEQRWRGARQRCTEDTGYHLDHLGEALHFGEPALFVEYAAWAAALLEGLKIPGEALALNLELMRTVLLEEIEGEGGALAGEYVDLALARIGAPAVAD